MLETTVLPIEYDKENQQEANKLKQILEQNQMLFQMFLSQYKRVSFLDIYDEEVLCINSVTELKEILSHIIPTYMDMLKKQVRKDAGEEADVVFLKMLLLDIISSKEKDEKSKETQDISDNINTIYAVVATDYYEQEQDLINFIFNPTGEEKEKIFKWLNQQHRYNLMNMLLEEEYQNMLSLESIEHDSYLRTHLEELLELSEIDMQERFKYTKEKESSLPKLTQKELDNLCTEFLIQIDPSLKWLKLYNKLKRNNNILYGEEFPDPCSKWGCIETTDEVYLYAPLVGDISDFMYFIHEFAHCITLFHKEKGECIPSSIQEFPSIFFERLATSFLREKGYSDQAVTALEEERIKSTLGNKSDISPSLRYLIDYINLGEITFEHEKEKMDRIRSAIPEELPDEMKSLLNDLMSTQDEDNVHIKIDAENSFIIEHPNCIFEEYPYILGSDLADRTLDKVGEDPMIIYKVLEITENLTKETAASVLQKLGLSETDYTSRKTSAQYTKQKNEN